MTTRELHTLATSTLATYEDTLASMHKAARAKTLDACRLPVYHAIDNACNAAFEVLQACDYGDINDWTKTEITAARDTMLSKAVCG